MFSRWLSQINPISAIIDLFVALISGYLIARIPQKKIDAESDSFKSEPKILPKGELRSEKYDQGPYFVIESPRYSGTKDTGGSSLNSDGDAFAIILFALVLSALTVAVMAKYWLIIKWVTLAAIALLTAIMFYFRNYYKFDAGRQLFTAAFLVESFIAGLIVFSLQFKIGSAPTIEQIGASLSSSEVSLWGSSTIKLLGISGLTIWIARIGALSLSLIFILSTFTYSFGLWLAPKKLEGSVAEFKAEVAGFLTKGRKYTIKRLILDIVAGVILPLTLAFALPVLLPIVAKPH